MLQNTKYTAYFTQIRKIVIAIYLRLHGYLVRYFYFFFIFLTKFDIYHCDVTDLHVARLGLTKLTVAQDEAATLFFKDAR